MTSPLITAPELAELLSSGSPVTLLDARWALGRDDQREQYLAGHLPGAVFVDLETDLSAKHPSGAGGRHPMPSPEAFEATMRRLGVSDDVPVVVYDAGKSLAPARLWWMLRYFGKDDVQVLDGGLRAWTENGGEVVPGTFEPATEGDFRARPGAKRMLAAEDVLPFGAAGGVIVDGRPEDRFRGENDTVDPRPGHVPGARNVMALKNVGPDDRFLAPEALRERFAAAGVTGEQDVLLYCGSGVQAAHLALAMDLTGLGDDPAIYVGSWSDWSAREDLPVETGPAR